MISVTSQGSGTVKSPRDQRSSIINKSIEMAGDNRRDAIEPYKNSPRANSRTNAPAPNVQKNNSVTGFNKMSSTSLNKGGRNSESMKSSVKSNKRTPNRNSQKVTKKKNDD